MLRYKVCFVNDLELAKFLINNFRSKIKINVLNKRVKML